MSTNILSDRKMIPFCCQSSQLFSLEDAESTAMSNAWLQNDFARVMNKFSMKNTNG